MLNLINSLRSIEGPIQEIWVELAKVLKGKMPADISLIEQYEIKKKVVQLQMLSENIKELDNNTRNFFEGVLDQNNANKWTVMIKTGSMMKKNIINLLKVFINFLEDEQLLMVTKGEDTSMQDIAEVNSELCSLFKTSIYQLYQMIKNLKKEIDTLQKILRKKSTMMYTY
jgi:flagellar capping protein FliD